MYSKPKSFFMPPLLRLWVTTLVVVANAVTMLTAFFQNFLSLCRDLLFVSNRQATVDTKIPYIHHDAQFPAASFSFALPRFRSAGSFHPAAFCRTDLNHASMSGTGNHAEANSASVDAPSLPATTSLRGTSSLRGTKQSTPNSMPSHKEENNTSY